MKHSIVYAELGMYAGWPANHGAWQWGDQFLVGFLRGKYKQTWMHNIAEPFQKVQARSHDGGEHWAIEIPDVDFECISPQGTLPRLDLLQGDIIRVCGVYDHGGDVCNEAGGFYRSYNFGHAWQGPYSFSGLEEQFSGNLICTARTRVYKDLVFLSYGQRDIWGTDAIFCARHSGNTFQFVGTVCDDNARAVMPAVAGIGNKIVAVMRRRKTGVREGWIDAVHSEDGGASWSKPKLVGVTGSRNGNPPALVALPDGRLVCCFGNRDEGSLVYAVSEDGLIWKSGLVRTGSEREKDIGYPQLFLRSDGKPVCVYYWADQQHPHQHIAATMLENI